jgi:hypothetical protein
VITIGALLGRILAAGITAALGGWLVHSFHGPGWAVAAVAYVLFNAECNYYLTVKRIEGIR